MSVKAYLGWTFYECHTGDGFNPEDVNLSEKAVKEYLKENPFPEDPMYDEDNLFIDLISSPGIYVLPANIRKPTIIYIENMLNDLWLLEGD